MKNLKENLCVNTLREASAQLHDLHTFDPQVFLDVTTSYNVKPKVSNFVLMLAIVHTEIKNLCILRSWVGSQNPSQSISTQQSERTKEYGEYCGISNYLFRITIGTVVELLNKIQKSKDIVDSIEFSKIYKKIPKI